MDTYDLFFRPLIFIAICHILLLLFPRFGKSQNLRELEDRYGIEKADLRRRWIYNPLAIYALWLWTAQLYALPSEALPPLIDCCYLFALAMHLQQREIKLLKKKLDDNSSSTDWLSNHPAPIHP